MRRGSHTSMALVVSTTSRPPAATRTRFSVGSWRSWSIAPMSLSRKRVLMGASVSNGSGQAASDSAGSPEAAPASACSACSAPAFCERSTTNATTIATSVSAAPIR